MPGNRSYRWARKGTKEACMFGEDSWNLVRIVADRMSQVLDGKGLSSG